MKLVTDASVPAGTSITAIVRLESGDVTDEVNVGDGVNEYNLTPSDGTDVTVEFYYDTTDPSLSPTLNSYEIQDGTAGGGTQEPAGAVFTQSQETISVTDNPEPVRSPKVEGQTGIVMMDGGVAQPAHKPLTSTTTLLTGAGLSPEPPRSYTGGFGTLTVDSPEQRRMLVLSAKELSADSYGVTTGEYDIGEGTLSTDGMVLNRGVQRESGLGELETLDTHHSIERTITGVDEYSFTFSNLDYSLHPQGIHEIVSFGATLTEVFAQQTTYTQATESPAPHSLTPTQSTVTQVWVPVEIHDLQNPAITRPYTPVPFGFNSYSIAEMSRPYTPFEYTLSSLSPQQDTYLINAQQPLSQSEYTFTQTEYSIGVSSFIVEIGETVTQGEYSIGVGELEAEDAELLPGQEHSLDTLEMEIYPLIWVPPWAKGDDDYLNDNNPDYVFKAKMLVRSLGSSSITDGSNGGIGRF